MARTRGSGGVLVRSLKTVLEGSVRYAGNDVRIMAQLIDPATGAHLWSEAYQRKIDDVFAIQSDIAMNIANALRAEFSLDEQRAIELQPTSSAEAYDLYLRARALAIDNSAVAQELLDRAIALDPNFAAAYAAKARMYAGKLANTTVGNAVRPAEREATLRQVREYANRTLALANLVQCGDAGVSRSSQGVNRSGRDRSEGGHVDRIHRIEQCVRKSTSSTTSSCNFGTEGSSRTPRAPQRRSAS